MSQCATVEGMKLVAEKDNFEYPVESIIGHALIGDKGFGEGDIVQLGKDHKRTAKKTSYQFLVKWAGHEIPTWQPFKYVSRYSHFPGYVVNFPGLRMDD
jgi:hypothetical protein